MKYAEIIIIINATVRIVDSGMRVQHASVNHIDDECPDRQPRKGARFLSTIPLSTQ